MTSLYYIPSFMVCITSKSEIEACSSGSKLIEWLTISMWQRHQLSLIFQLQLYPPHVLTRMFLTNKPDFTITATHITWYKLHIPYQALLPHAICIVQHIHKLHRERRNIFHETITNVYTIKYEKCIYNTLIDQMFDYKIAVLCLAAFFPGSTLGILSELMALREEYQDDISILQKVDNLLTL